MGKESQISWTQHTWNPWQVCKKVSEGCKFCYMFREKFRYGQVPTDITRSKDQTFYQPRTYGNEGKLVFVCSWSDFFIQEADLWRAEVWEIIKAHPQHTFQILTKRPENIASRLPEDWGEGYDNVWLGISAENQERLLQRAKIFQAVTAKTKFLSAEPLLGEINLLDTIEIDVIEYANLDVGQLKMNLPAAVGKENRPIHTIFDWVIAGGESGNGTKPEDSNVKYQYRIANVLWYLKLQKQCNDTKIAFFMKQLGSDIAKQLRLKDRAGAVAEEWKDFGLSFTQDFPNNYKG